MKVTIVGGGNIGTQFAVHFAEQGHEVRIYTSKPKKFSKNLEIVDQNDVVIHKGEIQLVTNSEKIAFQDANMILVTVPSFIMDDAAKKIIPYVKEGTMIGIMPGNGGGEIAFKDAIKKKATIFGMQRVPSVARLVEYGKKVRATGYRDKLYVSAIPNKFTDKCRKIIEEVFKINCEALPEYLNLTLTPSNPILHTTRLYTLFSRYSSGKVYKELPLFYEEWDQETTKLIFKCDSEVQGLCEKLRDFDLKEVKSLREHYENNTVEGFTNKIRSIEGFKGLKTPAVKLDSGYIPDLNSRYFKADFDYGLNIILQIAHIYNFDMKYCSKIMNWYTKIENKNNKKFSYKRYGITNKDEFINFYKK